MTPNCEPNVHRSCTLGGPGNGFGTPKSKHPLFLREPSTARVVQGITWCTNLFPCLKRWIFRMQRHQWTRSGKSSNNISLAVGQRNELQGSLSGITKNTKNSRRWTPVISQTLSWNLSVRSTQTGLCSEVTLKDDSGSYAVLAEQGSSVSQITAAIAMGVIARLIVQEKKPTQHQLAK